MILRQGHRTPVVMGLNQEDGISVLSCPHNVPSRPDVTRKSCFCFVIINLSFRFDSSNPILLHKFLCTAATDAQFWLIAKYHWHQFKIEIQNQLLPIPARKSVLVHRNLEENFTASWSWSWQVHFVLTSGPKDVVDQDCWREARHGGEQVHRCDHAADRHPVPAEAAARHGVGRMFFSRVFCEEEQHSGEEFVSALE